MLTVVAIIFAVKCMGIILMVPPANASLICGTYTNTGQCINQDFDKCLLTLDDGTSLNVSTDDFVGLKDCGTCADIFGDLNTNLCVDAPCDGLICKEENYRYHFSFDGSMMCDKGNILQQDCSDCDTACMDICNTEYIVDTRVAQCLYDLTDIGDMETQTGLCGGEIPQLLCDDASITCVIFDIPQTWANEILLDFDLEKSVLIFGDAMNQFWAMDKATAIATSFQLYDRIDVYSTPFCSEIEPLYGSTNLDFSSEQNSAVDGGISTFKSFLF